MKTSFATVYSPFLEETAPLPRLLSQGTESPLQRAKSQTEQGSGEPGKKIQASAPSCQASTLATDNTLPRRLGSLLLQLCNYSHYRCAFPL